MKLDEEIEKGALEIIGSFQCLKDYDCYKSGFENPCKAREFGSNYYLECLDESAEDCSFASNLSTYWICKCPLRFYIAKKLNK